MQLISIQQGIRSSHLVKLFSLLHIILRNVLFLLHVVLLWKNLLFILSCLTIIIIIVSRCLFLRYVRNYSSTLMSHGRGFLVDHFEVETSQMIFTLLHRFINFLQCDQLLFPFLIDWSHRNYILWWIIFQLVGGFLVNHILFDWFLANLKRFSRVNNLKPMHDTLFVTFEAVENVEARFRKIVCLCNFIVHNLRQLRSKSALSSLAGRNYLVCNLVCVWNWVSSTATHLFW